MKGLICEIFRGKNCGDCSNNGISNRYDEVLLVDDDIPEIFDDSTDRPTVKIIKRKLFGNTPEYLSAEPIDKGGRHNMMGGCFIWSTDSRFPADYPIPLHDRFEDQIDETDRALIAADMEID